MFVLFHLTGADAPDDAAVHATAAEPGGAVDDDEPGGAGGHQPDPAGASEAAGRLAGALQVHDSFNFCTQFISWNVAGAQFVSLLL